VVLDTVSEITVKLDESAERVPARERNRRAKEGGERRGWDLRASYRGL
jgi:hypothetical protein